MAKILNSSEISIADSISFFDGFTILFGYLIYKLNPNNEAAFLNL